MFVGFKILCSLFAHWSVTHRSVLISVFTISEELFCHTDHAAARWTQVSPCGDYRHVGLERYPCCVVELLLVDGNGHKVVLVHAHYQRTVLSDADFQWKPTCYPIKILFFYSRSKLKFAQGVPSDTIAFVNAFKVMCFMPSQEWFGIFLCSSVSIFSWKLFVFYC